jgi:hypothetical protein
MDKQKYLIHLYEMKEKWESKIIAKEQTISLFSEFFNDRELEKQYKILAYYRECLDAINADIEITKKV